MATPPPSHAACDGALGGATETHMHGGIRSSVQSQPAAEAQGHRYNQRPSRTAPSHTPGAPPRRWGGCSGIKPGLKRQHAPRVPVAARGSAHPRGSETNQHSFDYDFPAQPHAARARVVSGTGTPRNRHVHMPGRNIDWTNISMHTCPRLWFSGSHLFRFHMH